MSESAVSTYTFPPALVTRADLAHLVREVEAIDNEFEAQKARARAAGKQVAYSMPNASRVMVDFLRLNSVDIADDKGRVLLKEQLRTLKDKAPIMHMTFAVEADPLSLSQLVTYLRKEIHPQTLLSVGLQPALVGGAFVRTPNHVHDFSLRERLGAKRDVIAQDLESLLGGGVVQ